MKHPTSSSLAAKSRPTTLVTLLTLCCLLLWLPPALAADETPGDCPANADLQLLLDNRQQQLQGNRDRLAIFLEGQNTDAGIPAAALFVVNLDDEVAVARRIEALRAQLAAATVTSAFSQTLPACARQQAVFTPQLATIDELERAIDTARLTFLTLPLERRSTLLRAQQSVVNRNEAAQELVQQRDLAEQQKSAALKSIVIAEEFAKSAATVDLRELGAQRTLLEKTREELATIKTSWTTSLHDRLQIYQSYASSLAELSATLHSNDYQARIDKGYEQAALIWRELVDVIFTRLADPQRSEALPKPTPSPEALLQRLAGAPAAADYIQAHSEMQVQYQALVDLRNKRFDEERDSAYRLLLQAGALRSDLLNASLDRGYTDPLQLSDSYFQDLSREIRVVPYRWIAIFYSKLLDIRQKLGSGLAGFIDIINQALIVAVVVAIPFVSYFALRRLTEQLNTVRRDLLQQQARQGMANGQAKGLLALWIQRLNPYLPWFVMLLGLWLAEDLIASTDLAEIASVVPYISYYIGYRILVNVIVRVVGPIAYRRSMQTAGSARERVQKTALDIGRFFLVAVVLLHAVEDVVGRALVYRIVYDVMLYVGALVCFYAARQWHAEILRSAEETLPAPLTAMLKRYHQGWGTWVLSLPALLVISIAYLFQAVADTANEIDFFKRIGAEMFRRRIEGAVGERERRGVYDGDRQLPADYLQHFGLGAPTDPALLIEPTSGIVKDICEIIEQWHSGASDNNSLALYGDKGSGKSSLLRVMDQHVHDCDILHITVPTKLCSREAVRDFFAQHINLAPNPEGHLLPGDPSGARQLVMIDEAHNLFLSTLGGFEGYKAFLELITADNNRYFWLANFNRHSWDYLTGVFKGHQYFNQVFEATPMNELDIEKMIMRRHELSGQRLSYDSIIRATESADEYAAVEQIEAQFFRLLWGQSKGNPRAAMVLWTSALRVLPGKVLRVGIPSYVHPKGLERLKDDTIFVYAAIIRHENLSAKELSGIVNLPEGVVLDALKIGLENEVIARSERGVYRVTPMAQFTLVQLLTGKNFIYG